MTLEVVSRFLDHYNLPWLLLAIMTWLVIRFSCSRKSFLHGLPVGIWTMVTGAGLEQFFINQKFWAEHFVMIHVGELDLFVIIGPFFSIGLLLIRFLPESRLGKYLAVLSLSVVATGIELISIRLGFMDYRPEKWNALHSLCAYSLSLMSALGFYYSYYSNRFS